MEIGVVRRAAEVIPAIEKYWDEESRYLVTTAPAMSEMIEDAIDEWDPTLFASINSA